MSIMLLGAIVGLIFLVMALGGSRFSQQVVIFFEPVGSGAARHHLVFRVHEIEKRHVDPFLCEWLLGLLAIWGFIQLSG